MSVIINTPGLDKLASQSEHTKRLEELSKRAAFMMRQYVPVEEGTLRASEQISSQYAQGMLIWNTPYAAKHYYVPMNHTKPGTSDHWDEVFMRNDMEKLVKYAETMYKE